MLDITESSITFEAIYSSEYVPNDPSIKEANLLIIPYHNYRPDVEYCFGEYSEEFFRYIKDNASEELCADIAIDDEKYQCTEMHSLLLDIGKFIVCNVVLGFAINLLSSFVYDKIKRMHEKKERVNVRVEIIAQNSDGSSTSLKFDGPASKFESVKDAAERIIEK